jgi:hypothetical protein
MTVTSAQKIKPPSDGREIFDDFEALTALVQKSFMEAAKNAVAENDRLGIPIHGSVGGKLIVRHPPKVEVPAHR